jgi:hypothetical protein
VFSHPFRCGTKLECLTSDMFRDEIHVCNEAETVEAAAEAAAEVAAAEEEGDESLLMSMEQGRRNFTHFLP